MINLEESDEALRYKIRRVQEEISDVTHEKRKVLAKEKVKNEC